MVSTTALGAPLNRNVEAVEKPFLKFMQNSLKKSTTQKHSYATISRSEMVNVPPIRLVRCVGDFFYSLVRNPSLTMRSLFVILVLMFSLSGWAVSNPPTPTPRESAGEKQGQSTHAEQQSKDEIAKAFDSVYEKISTFRSEYQAYVDRKHEEKKAHYEFFIAWGTVLLALFTLLLFVATYLLYRTTVKLVADAEKASRRQIDSTQTIERAYVKMSHRKPGAVFTEQIEEDKTKKIFCRVTFEVTNFGSTPALVSKTYARIIIVGKDEIPPPKPDYREGGNIVAMGESFIVRQESFSVPIESHIPDANYQQIQNGQQKICVFGYVDYVDRFGCHHRAGYARMYTPEHYVIIIGAPEDTRRNNLVFPSFDGYNYDRKRDQKDEQENHDWKK